ncbi:MAG: hypothetical protein R3C68_05540 [Myxococcota bacterium]
MHVADASERRIVPRGKGRGKKPTILVVEDNQDMIRFIGGLLGHEYDVLAAMDGEAGLELAKRMSPDLIVGC